MSQHKQHAWYLHAFAMIAAQSLVSTAAMAQDTPVDLGKVDVVQQAANTSVTKQNKATEQYQSYDPVDSGMSVISRGAINQSSEGGIDTTELLKTLPFVQMDINRDDVSQENMQSIRPTGFSIAGGNYYDNNIRIDGVSATSILDSVSIHGNRNSNEIYGQTSQTVYINPNLLENVVVRDSNISARYGSFTGGVVDFELRQPTREFGIDFSAGYQNDSMQHYKVAEIDKENAEDNAAPEFHKYESAISVDLPISDKLFLLASYSRAESSVTYQMGDAYQGEQFTNGDTSENFLLKGLYEYSDAITAEAQLVYSPYASEYQEKLSINSLNINDSNGLSGFVKLSGIGEQLNWQTKLSYNESKQNRDWDGDRYQWPSDSDYVNWCTSRNCAEGGYGDMQQYQKDYTFEFSGDTPLWQGTLAFGTEILHTAVQRDRDTTYYYRTGETLADLQKSGIEQLLCNANDPACKSNDVVLTFREDYRGYTADVDVNRQSLWTEYQKTINTVNLRAGVRYSHESFLDNHNIAPRFTASWEFMPEMFFTVGANRYYANNMVAYAIRAKYPNTYSYSREVNADGTVSDWELSRDRPNNSARLSELDTPYSDEYTSAITLPTPLDGTFRVKGVLRHYRDSFSATMTESFATETETGTYRTSDMVLNNDGKSDYRGLSVEWSGSYQNHYFNANTTWSKTTSYGSENYLNTFDPNDYSTEMVYYQGAVRSMADIDDIQGRQNYAAPLRASVGWSANWFDEKLLTSLQVYYRGKYTSIEDTREDIEVDGNDYNVYDELDTKASTQVNFNVKYRVFDYNNHNMMLTVKVNNLLDSIPHSNTSRTNPYQKGRSFWIGVDYHY